MSALTRQKLEQAAQLVGRSGADVWLTFVRETAEGGDPVLPLILEGGLTWQSALMVGRNGRRAAVVGNYDADALRASGDWHEVTPYVQSIREPLLEALEKMVAPGGRVAVNYSQNDVKADGLSHGLFLLLESYLRGTRFEGCLVSAERTVMALRGQKTPEEIRRMKGAIEATDRLFQEISDFARPGVTEKAVYDHVQALIRQRGLGFSWGPVGDPIVNSGPSSMIGHGLPSDSIRIEEGHVFHVDLGVIQDGYASDVQRCWYVGSSVPEDVQRAFDAVSAAITSVAEELRPGALGKGVDAAARRTLVERGYAEYLHAFGHQVGRVAHDGGAILGPEWPRYGETPRIPIEKGEVYTLELGVEIPGRGYLGLEEMALVTGTGIEWLTERQQTLPLCSG